MLARLFPNHLEAGCGPAFCTFPAVLSNASLFQGVCPTSCFFRTGRFSGYTTAPQRRPQRGHWPSLAFMVVTFMPMMSRSLLNLLTSVQASSVLPTLAPAEPIINIPFSLLILSLNKFGSRCFETYPHLFPTIETQHLYRLSSY